MLRNQTEAWFTDRTTFHHLSHAKKKQNVMTTGIGTGLRFSVKNDHDDETVTKLGSFSVMRAQRVMRPLPSTHTPKSKHNNTQILFY